MKSELLRGLRGGLSFALVIIFLVLIGFTVVAAQWITVLQGKMIEGGTPTTLLIFLGVLGVWLGSSAARSPHHQAESAQTVAIRATATGLTAGAVVGAIGAVLALIEDAGIDLRAYLFKLSPEAARLFTLGQTPVNTLLIYIGFFTVTCLGGAMLAWLLGRINLRSGVRNVWVTGWDTFRDNSAVKQAGRNPITKYVLYALVAGALIYLPNEMNSFWIYTLGTVGIYVLMGLGLNIVVGLAGLLDLGYVVFFGIGAYSVALLTAPAPHNLLWNYWIALPIGIALAAAWGVLLGIPVLRLRGDYLAIVTLGFGEIIRVLSKADAMVGFSNGAKGVTSIGQPILFGYEFVPRDFMYMIILGVLLVIFVTNRLQHSHVGRAWIAIREDETVAQAMGINTLYYKLLAFGIGAAFAGLGGAIYASRNQFTGPEDLTLMVSINVLSEIIVGGMGSIPGVITGAFALKGLPEILRELADYRQLGFGALLVLMMILRPQGFLPSAHRQLEMKMEMGDETPLDELDTSLSNEAAK